GSLGESLPVPQPGIARRDRRVQLRRRRPARRHRLRRRHRLVGSVTRPRSAGFTLVELLVVIVVIGLAASLVYAQLERDPRQALEREGRRLAGALEHAALLAQWKNQTIGVSAAGGSYQFWRRTPTADGERWVALSDDDVLVPRALPAPLAISTRS